MREEKRRDDERGQPWVRNPEAGQRDAETRNDHVDRERLSREQPALANRLRTREAQHRREHQVVDEDPDG